MKVEPVKLFTYGTLRIGRANFPAIAQWVVDAQPATTTGVLVSLGTFPAMLPGPGIVEGDLLLVRPEALVVADRIEGVAHSFYLRKEVATHLENGATVKAWAYFYGNRDAVADRPQLIIGVENGTGVFAWRRNLGALAPRLTAADPDFERRTRGDD